MPEDCDGQKNLCDAEKSKAYGSIKVIAYTHKKQYIHSKVE